MILKTVPVLIQDGDEFALRDALVREMVDKSIDNDLSYSLTYGSYDGISAEHSVILSVSGQVPTHPVGSDGEGGLEWHVEPVSREIALSITASTTVEELAAQVIDSLRDCINDAHADARQDIIHVSDPY